MTISSTVRRAGPYAGNDAATSFAFTFKVFLESEVVVTLAVLATGVEEELVLDTDYVVVLNADQNTTPGGSVTYPISGSPMSSTHTLTLTSAVEQKQETDIQNAGGFFPEVIEDALDREMIVVQQLAERVDRTLRFPVSDVSGAGALPTVTQRANKALTFDALGNPIAADISGSVISFSPTTEAFDGTGAQVAFALSGAPNTASALIVRIDGVVQTPITDFTVSGTTLTFTTAPAAGSGNVVVQNFGIAAVVGTVGVDDVTGLSASTGASKVGFAQSGTGAIAETVAGLLGRQVVMVTSYMTDAQRADYAAKTATLDMTVAIQNAAARVQALGGGVLWFPPGKARVFSTTTGNLSSFEDLDGVAVLGYGATVEVWQGKTITASEGIFFSFDNCKNITVDGFLTDGPTLDISATPVKGYEFVRCVNGCRNISMPVNRVKNMIAGFIASKALGDADSMRTQNIHIGVLDIVNCWYGVNGQYSGDFTTVDVLRTDTVHRSFFFYGASHLKANIWSKDHKAADVIVRTLTGGAIVEDVEINYSSGADSTACADIPKIMLDFGDQTAGTLRDIRLHVSDRRHSTGTTGGASVFITKTNTGGNPDTVDQGHKLENFKLSGSLTGTPSYNSGGGVVMDTLATWGTGDDFSNLAIENFRIDSSDAKAQINLVLANLNDQLLLKNVYSPGYFTIYQSAADVQIPQTGKLLLDNVTCLNRFAVSTAQPLDNVRPYSTPYTIPLGWANGKTINNSNNGGGNTEYDLPAATVGLEYTFVRTNANVMDLDPNGSEVIRGGTAGQLLRMNADGNMVTLKCYVAGTWEVIAFQGSYSFV